MKPITPLALLLVALCGCSEPKPDTLVDFGYDQKEMDAAIARARSEVDAFVSELSKPTGSEYAVKAPIEDGGEVEHFWLVDVSFKDDKFEGTISNEPGLVGNVTLGQKWTVSKTDISDWMYMKGGKMHGNYMMRPLLSTMSEDEAAQFRAMLADP